jgi:Flp pilus assembly protein TadG
MVNERGQASVELIAAIPLLLLAGAIALQLLLACYALTLADGAAEAGALALAAGRPARSAAEDSLPSWAADRAEIAVRGGGVTVRLAPPSLLAAVADRLVVSSESFARPAER